MYRIKKAFPAVFIIWIVGVYSAPAETTEEAFLLEQITVTATRQAKSAFETPRAIPVATVEEILRRNPVNTVDILREEVGIQAQKTTYGQGSPIIRGLTGYYTMIDGLVTRVPVEEAYEGKEISKLYKDLHLDTDAIIRRLIH